MWCALIDIMALWNCCKRKTWLSYAVDCPYLAMFYTGVVSRIVPTLRQQRWQVDLRLHPMHSVERGVGKSGVSILPMWQQLTTGMMPLN